MVRGRAGSGNRRERRGGGEKCLGLRYVLQTSPGSSPRSCVPGVLMSSTVSVGSEVSKSSIWLSETASFLILLSLLPPLKAELGPGMTAPLAALRHASMGVCSPDLRTGAAVNPPAQQRCLDLQFARCSGTARSLCFLPVAGSSRLNTQLILY